MPEKVSVSDIRAERDVQSRVEVSESVATEYAEAMLEGHEFPPITVFFDGNDYWLADGFHRLVASKISGAGAIACDVREGGKRDAALHAVSCNATHGFRRSNADKRAAVMRLLRDEEWSQWSDREIARRALVGNAFVSRLRASICVRETDSSKRKAVRNGKSYEMDTANIGSSKEPHADVEPPQRDLEVSPNSTEQGEPERVVFDAATGEVVSHPWSPEQKEEFYRRDDFALDLVDNLEWIVGLTPRQVCDDVLPEDRDEVGRLLKKAAARLREIHSTWSKEHVSTEEHGKQNNL